MYRKLALQYLQDRELEKCIDSLKEIARYSKAAYDQVLYARVCLTLANIYISGSVFCDQPADYQSAKSYFKVFKNIHEECFNDKMTFYGYK